MLPNYSLLLQGPDCTKRLQISGNRCTDDAVRNKNISLIKTFLFPHDIGISRQNIASFFKEQITKCSEPFWRPGSCEEKGRNRGGN